MASREVPRPSRDEEEARRAWRHGIAVFANKFPVGAVNNTSELTYLRAQPWYRIMRDHLNNEEREVIETADPANPTAIGRTHITVHVGATEHPRVKAMSGAVRRVEKGWKLV